MFLFYLVIAALQLQISYSLFEDCPIDRQQRVGTDLVIEVAENFYRDLNFLQAVTEVQQLRDYSNVRNEIKILGRVHHLKHLENELLRRNHEVIELLQRNNPTDAIKKCDAVANELRKINPVDLKREEITSAQSYLHYFKAEAYRLLLDHAKAMDQIAEATRYRQSSIGISLNELEKLNGLIVVERISNYNHEVDQMFGLSRGPNITLLATSYSRYSKSLEPLNAHRATSYRRNNPSQDDLSGQSVARRSLLDILCEFMQKLAATGASSNRRQSSSADYNHVLSELQQLNASFAKELKDKVAKNIVLGQMDDAVQQTDRLSGKIWDFDCWTLLESSNSSGKSLYENKQLRELEAYTKYFQAEAYRRSDDFDSLTRSEFVLDRVKQIRKAQIGVSMGKLVELEGKIVFKTLMCLGKRIKSIYRLDGNESARDLENKRARYGTCERTLAAR